VSVCSVYTVHSRVCCRPPKCLTCPCYLRGLTPCIGIITVLSNLEPFKVQGRQDLSVSSWLEGNTLLRPEIFHDRWRTDKDPTKELPRYAAIVKQPLSRSGVGGSEPQAVLEQDLETQFNTDMLALNELDPIGKQHALKQLKPILGKFSSTVAKFVMDARIMKTSQGRGAGRSEASLIAKKATKAAAPPKARPMYPVTGAAASPIASATIASAKGYGKKVPAAARSRPGTSRNIPPDQLWTCNLCRRSVKNTPDSIKQHKNGETHMTLAAKMHYCDACDIYCDNTPDSIRLHNDSYDHGHQRRMGADAQRDGSACAEKRRGENNGRVVEPSAKKKK
jgi:hypothetical protein